MNNAILIVDDVEENRDILGRILKRKNFEVAFAISGTEALEAAKLSPPALILMDINMPEIDGFETCRRIKEVPELESIPVIFISARSEAVDKLEAFGVGGVDYVTKPFDFREVVARVNTHLELRRLQLTVEENYRQLTALEETRDDLVNMIVHDMRSPLSVLSMALNTIDREVRDHVDQETREDIDAAKENVRRLILMTDNVLQNRRLESNELPLSLSVVDLEALAHDIAEEMRPLARRHEIVVDAAEVEKTALCDREQVRRMIVNLISNAIKAMNAPGKITLRIDADEGMHRIEVQDTGVGIEPERLETVFHKFVHGKGSEGYDASQSVGLGLAMCKLSAEAHGGAIEVESEAGVGSRFSILLPRRSPGPS